MRKLDFLKRLSIAVLSPLMLAAETPGKVSAAGSDPLVGLWEVSAVAKAATYRYIYSISPGSYIATGDIDEAFQGFKFSPTMGTYVRYTDGSYRYLEKGWVFDMKGKNVGTFQSAGIYRLNAGATRFNGPGTFTQYDLRGKALYSERFDVAAKRVSV